MSRVCGSDLNVTQTQHNKEGKKKMGRNTHTNGYYLQPAELWVTFLLFKDENICLHRAVFLLNRERVLCK